MAFQWKAPKDIWKGEGIYHLTFAVVNRTPLLGRLVPLEQCVRQGVRRRTELADVEYTTLGRRIHYKIEELETRYPELKICAKVIMPDHIHIVLWRQDATEDSIRQLGKGFAQGCSKIARELAQAPAAAKAPAAAQAPAATQGPAAAQGEFAIIAPSDGAIITDAPCAASFALCATSRAILLHPCAKPFANWRMLSSVASLRHRTRWMWSGMMTFAQILSSGCRFSNSSILWQMRSPRGVYSTSASFVLRLTS